MLGSANPFAILPSGHLGFDGRWLAVTPALCHLLGRSEQELLNGCCQDFLHPDDLESTRDHLHQLGRREVESAEMDRRFLRNDGRMVWVSLSCSLVMDPGGQPLHILAFFRDITQRKRGEEILVEDERRYRAVFDLSPIGILLEDTSGKILDANESICQSLGYNREELIGKSAMVLVPAVEREQRLKETETVLRGRLVKGESVIVRKDGALRWMDISRTRVVLPNGQEGVLQAAQDITDHKRAEEALRESEASLAAAQRLAHLGSWEVALRNSDNLAANPVWWSEETYRIFGHEIGAIETTLDRMLQAIPSEEQTAFRAQMEAVARGEPSFDIEHRILRPDGSERVVREHAELLRDPVHGRPVKLVGIVQDITEHKKLESQFLQAQKMEGIGTLAGGVAHDFNNILTVILGNSDLLLQNSRLGAESRELLRQISAAAGRAANLTRRLLTFSRRQPLHSRQIRLDEVVDGFSKMLRRIIGEDIEFACHYQPGLPMIMADQGMIEQILMNLAANARDALPKGGHLGIRTESVNIDALEARKWAGARAGQYVCLSVEDNGCGIAPDVLCHVFEPFFTTKAVGKGTGLGLATVYGIVRQHHGWIKVESNVGQGTTFRIFFPSTESKPVAVGAAGVKPPYSSGTESVLVVEDEGSVRMLVRLCLKHCGYRVFEASNGVEALEVWDKHRHEIALLLTDVVMPNGVGGFELAAQLQRQEPKLKVIYTSGYSLAVPEGLQLEEGVNYLPKPYEPAQLAALVRQSLDSMKGNGRNDQGEVRPQTDLEIRRPDPSLAVA